MIAIDYRDPRPIYEQIVERYETLITGGVLKEGDQIPSVRDAAAALSLNPNTIQKAYSILTFEGYFYSVRGRGVFVSRDAGVREKKRKSYLSELSVCLEKGKMLGVTKSDVQKELEKVFGEEAAEQKEKLGEGI